MADYVIEANGKVSSESSGRTVAWFDDDGTVRAGHYGDTIGSVTSDGTVKDRFGRVLGVVESDGTVRDSRYGNYIGRVGPPVHRQGALLLLLG